MKILIYTVPGDVHVAAVRWLLRKRGHEVRTVAIDDFPQKLTSSIWLSQDAEPRFSWGAEAYDELWKADVIWNRRFGTPALSEELHESDVDQAQRECNDFVSSWMQLAGQSAFQINPRTAQRAARSKVIQLTNAREAGLRIPDTLVSNSPTAVRQFFDAHHGKVVYKNAVSHCWRNSDGGVANNLTALVTEEDLFDDEAIAQSSGIYQAMVPKLREFRVTIMGRKYFVAIPVSRNPEAIDTRMERSGFVAGDAYFSTELAEKCFALMNRLGIHFGCLDFVQPPDGSEPYFLEVNEMGQWLAIEREIPHFNMLATFCSLIESRDPAFKGKNGERDGDYLEFTKTAEFAECLEINRTYGRRLESLRAITFE